MARLGRLLVLLAVLLMPFGMAAAAATPPGHAAPASMPMPHCPDPAPGHPSKSAFAECTMACSAALPAMDQPSERALLVGSEPARPTAIKQLHGLHPETATPPPRIS